MIDPLFGFPLDSKQSQVPFSSCLASPLVCDKLKQKSRIPEACFLPLCSAPHLSHESNPMRVSCGSVHSFISTRSHIHCRNVPAPCHKLNSLPAHRQTLFSVARWFSLSSGVRALYSFKLTAPIACYRDSASRCERGEALCLGFVPEFHRTPANVVPLPWARIASFPLHVRGQMNLPGQLDVISFLLDLGVIASRAQATSLGNPTEHLAPQMEASCKPVPRQHRSIL